MNWHPRSCRVRSRYRACSTRLTPPPGTSLAWRSQSTQAREPSSTPPGRSTAPRGAQDQGASVLVPADYDSDSGRWQSWESPQDVHEMIDPDLRGPILDVSCGEGRLASLLGDDVSWIGVDSSPTQLAANRYRPVVRADMRALPFRDGAFAEVTHLWCLYHPHVLPAGDPRGNPSVLPSQLYSPPQGRAGRRSPVVNQEGRPRQRREAIDCLKTLPRKAATVSSPLAISRRSGDTHPRQHRLPFPDCP